MSLGIPKGFLLNAPNAVTVVAARAKATCGSLPMKSKLWRPQLACRSSKMNSNENSLAKSGNSPVWSNTRTAIAFFSIPSRELALFTQLDQSNAELGLSGKATLSRKEPGHKLQRTARDAIKADSTV